MHERILRRAVELAMEAARADAATERVVRGLRLAGPIHVLSVGKAALGMACGAASAIGESDIAEILVVAPQGGAAPRAARVLVAAHPLPDERSERAADEAIALVGRATGTLLVLLSGGGSSLLEKPLDGLSFADLSRASALLSAEGAPIERWNAVRGSLSAVKHGRLLAHAQALRVVNVVISDVPGASPTVVASGPTSPPPSVDLDEVARVLGRRFAPPPVHLPTQPELHVAASAESVRDAVARALVEEQLVPSVHRVAAPVLGEASEAAIRLIGELDRCSATALVAAGEVTVRVTGDGVGGPAAELALAVLARSSVSALALGTDGIDGRSDAAGAFVTPAVRARVLSLGLDPIAALAAHDSATFFARAGGAVVTGPTGTNTAELYVLLKPT